MRWKFSSYGESGKNSDCTIEVLLPIGTETAGTKSDQGNVEKPDSIASKTEEKRYLISTVLKTSRLRVGK